MKVLKKVIIKNKNKDSKTYLIYCEEMVIIRTLILVDEKEDRIDPTQEWRIFNNKRLLVSQTAFTPETFYLMLQAMEFADQGLYKMTYPKQEAV